MNTDKELRESIAWMEEEIQELEQRLEMVKSIDWEKPVNEDEWHEICETPLRGTNLLGVMVKTIFPNAEDVSHSPNYESFKLDGFDVSIPTSRRHGIDVDFSWYNRNLTPPKHFLDSGERKRMALLEALDNGSDWWTLETIINPKVKKMSRAAAWIDWFLFSKRRVLKQETLAEWRKEKDEIFTAISTKTDRWTAKLKEDTKRANVVIKELLPELNRFSPNVYFTFSPHGRFTVKELMEFEEKKGLAIEQAEKEEKNALQYV